MQDRLMKITTVLKEKVDLSKSKYYDLSSKGLAPKPIKLGGSALYSEIEIDAFVEKVKRGEVEV